MKAVHLILVSLVAAIGGMTAQARQTAAPADSPAATADCAKAAVAPHNHSAERGMGQVAIKPCATQAAAVEQASAASAPKKIKLHAHASFHKNQ